MTKEEKQLLLKDLCGRLPYGVMYETEYGPRIINDLFIYSNGPVYTDHNVGDYNEVYGIELGHIKPYLRPMSSMTEEEKNDYINTFSVMWDAVDWLNKKMFDYRGLIPMGLALEAKEGMYETE